MEELLLRFQHIGEEIFDSLDENSLEKCNKVCRAWKNFISNPNRKFIWIQAIKAHEENVTIKGYHNIHLKCYINGPKPQWSKLRIQDLKELSKGLIP